MPGQRTLNKRARDEKIRAYATDGKSVKWIAATFGVSNTIVQRVLGGESRGQGWPQDEDDAPAAWERSIARGERRETVPLNEWVDALEDVTSDYRGPVVYFIQVGETRTIKIGCSSTSTVRSRLRGLQNANPAKLHLRRMVKGDANVEAMLHAEFSDRRIRNEWFDCDDRLAAVAGIVS
jgi:Meiotically Up-regulated Gene 113 (MUG113) protein